MVPGDIDYLNPINWDHPLNRGLVGWWMPTPNLRGGTTLFDLARANHGTLTNMDPKTDWVGTTRRGGWGALDFDGTDDYVDVGGGPSVRPNAFTISAWINIDGAGSSHPVLGFTSTAAYPALYPYHSTSGVKRALFYMGPSNFRYFDADAIIFGNWHHVAFVIPGNSQLDINNSKVYLDGSELDTTFTKNTGTQHSKTDVLIGGARSEDRFVGKVDDIRIHNRVLSTDGVAALYGLSLRYYPGLLNRISQRRYFVQAAGTTVLLARSTETDTARTLTVSNPRSYSLGRATETDTSRAIAVANPRSYEVGQATETDTARSLAIVNPRSYTLGRAVETDTARALTIINAQAVAIGRVTETSIGRTLTVINPRSYAIGRASEASVARSLTVNNPRSYALGRTTETDTARALVVSDGTVSDSFIRFYERMRSL